MKYKHLRFDEIVPNKLLKTKIIKVSSLYDNSELGTIKWYGGWRQYTFEPIWQTRWSWDCLNELSMFIKTLMDKRKEFLEGKE